MKNIQKKSNFKFLLITITIISAIFPLLVSATYTLGDTDAPDINVTLAKSDPAFVEPGKVADIWILLSNEGSAIKNTKITFIDNYPVSLTSESERVKTISYIAEYYQMRYSVKIDPKAEIGTYYIKLRYSLGDGFNTEIEKEIPITIKKSQSIITIEDVSVTPEIIAPGETTKIALKINNPSESTILRNIEVNLGLSATTIGTEIVDLPFIPKGSSSSKSISELFAHETSVVEFSLVAYPSADSKLYKIPLTIKYTDDKGFNYTKSELIGISINTKPELLVTLENTELNKQVVEGKITINLINKGLNDIKFVTVTLLPTEEYDTLSASNIIYVGNIDSDDFETADFKIKTNNITDKTTIKAKIEYRDAFNTIHESQESILLLLQEPQQQKNGIITKIIIGVLIVGIIIYFVLRKKKQRI
ncbi:hypothetical protein J4232_00680 [Candidatus Woesearchaeota archaeon]|nr:hypothetical protein [Candidatus Woesearchaeota archaeon]